MKLSFCPFSAFLFASTAYAYTSHIRRRSNVNVLTKSCTKNTTPEPKFQVVFILGGPGSGKGTQCSLLSDNLGYAHLSAGDLLRAERQSGSTLAEVINSKISAGEIVPSSITVTLLKNAMEKIFKETQTAKFLIDGFPRSAENVSVWEEQLCSEARVEFVLFLDCPEDVMTGRLLERSKTSGRNDDNLEVIRKRFKTFRDESMPIVERYEKQGMLKHVVADRSIDDVYSEIENYFKNI